MGIKPDNPERVHDLKVWPEFFQSIIDGKKNFEIRFNDRDFQEGDLLVLSEFDIINVIYTGREITKKVSYLLKGPYMGIKDEFVVMGLKDPKN